MKKNAMFLVLGLGLGLLFGAHAQNTVMPVTPRLGAPGGYQCGLPVLDPITNGYTLTTTCIIGVPPPPPSGLSIGAVPLTGTVGVVYSAPLTATGGMPPYSFTATGLPPGIKLTTGSIGGGTSLLGIPSIAGSYNITLGAKDSKGNTGVANPVIVISAGSPPPPPPPVGFYVVTPSLPDATVGVPYSAPPLEATGGVAPYTWMLNNGTAPYPKLLPAGLITGTPIVPGVSHFTVTAKDSATPVPQTASKDLTITANAAP